MKVVIRRRDSAFRERRLCEPEACLLTWSEGQKASILSIQCVRDAGVLLVAAEDGDHQLEDGDHQLHHTATNWQEFRRRLMI